MKNLAPVASAQLAQQVMALGRTGSFVRIVSSIQCYWPLSQLSFIAYLKVLRCMFSRLLH